jgi:hypothetical protein
VSGTLTPPRSLLFCSQNNLFFTVLLLLFFQFFEKIQNSSEKIIIVPNQIIVFHQRSKTNLVKNSLSKFKTNYSCNWTRIYLSRTSNMTSSKIWVVATWIKFDSLNSGDHCSGTSGSWCHFLLVSPYKLWSHSASRGLPAFVDASGSIIPDVRKYIHRNRGNPELSLAQLVSQSHTSHLWYWTLDYSMK